MLLAGAIGKRFSDEVWQCEIDYSEMKRHTPEDIVESIKYELDIEGFIDKVVNVFENTLRSDNVDDISVTRAYEESVKIKKDKDFLKGETALSWLNSKTELCFSENTATPMQALRLCPQQFGTAL